MDDRLTEMSVRELVERLATDEPVPGGGSAAALTGAMGAALVQMVVELTVGRPTADGHDAELRQIGSHAAGSQSELLRLAEADAAAYAAVIAARRLSRGTERERESRRVRVNAAMRDATRAPLETARRAVGVFELAEALAPMGNRNAVSDIGVAGLLAAAALRGAALNVRINLPFLSENEPLRDEAAREIEQLLTGLEDRERTLQAAVAERME
ncbi:MAG: cyclodeaminase/cyclohydrolase family protein [Chloroflexi bacterium]|nr:cyclodeaminase/cyclohydrolase family protein [Chloroflexota bacterium]